MYWRYEWTYNEFMIHRVGKLNPHPGEYAFYDMLGNVWEWVRDDWTERVNAQNGSVNSIAGTRNADENVAVKKVIKGGAFD